MTSGSSSVHQHVNMSPRTGRQSAITPGRKLADVREQATRWALKHVYRSELITVSAASKTTRDISHAVAEFSAFSQCSYFPSFPSVALFRFSSVALFSAFHLCRYFPPFSCVAIFRLSPMSPFSAFPQCRRFPPIKMLPFLLTTSSPPRSFQFH